MPRRSAEQLLTVRDVLEELGGVSRSTFYRWRQLGLAPQGLRLPNGELRFSRRSFEEWLSTLEEQVG